MKFRDRACRNGRPCPPAFIPSEWAENFEILRFWAAGGQLLICTAGEGWYQEEGQPAVSLQPGTVITIPANVKHWHGAKRDSWFSHIAVEVPGTECKNEWCEPVSDEAYAKL